MTGPALTVYVRPIYGGTGAPTRARAREKGRGAQCEIKTKRAALFRSGRPYRREFRDCKQMRLRCGLQRRDSYTQASLTLDRVESADGISPLRTSGWLITCR